MSKPARVTLPLAELPAELLTFLVARVRSSDLLPLTLTCLALRDHCVAHVKLG